MAGFKDKAGRPWDVDINVVTVGRVRKALGINLLELVVPKSKLNEQLEDAETLVNVLYLLCKDQADAKGITDEDFGRALDIDSIDEGWDAILEGVVGFSRRAARPALQKVLDKARKYKTIQEEQIQKELADPELDARLDKAMEEAMAKMLGTSPTDTSTTALSSSESVESPQALTP